MTPTTAASIRRARGRQDQGEGNDNEPLDREAQEGAERQLAEVVRSDQGEPHQQAGKDRGRPGGRGAES